ncbi:unnamed protein product [Plutella xylostella]|uniref:(diamondback moth) hypothetical protein n=1 Tax=Plutella xylostella TaxID=51655 RepID=A0A8S4F021_PLUXY|nr:unnamed protein product [Plutella xylostella]
MVGMETLEVRRAVHTVVHYLRLLRGGVDNPAALSGVGLWAPTRGGSPRRAACARPPALAPVVEVTTVDEDAVQPAVFLMRSRERPAECAADVAAWRALCALNTAASTPLSCSTCLIHLLIDCAVAFL